MKRHVMKLRNFALTLLFALALAGIAIPGGWAQSNVIGTLFSSAARTSTTSSSDVTNLSYRGVHVIVNTTAYTSGTWTPTLEGKDPVSGNYYTICTGRVVSSVGMTVFKVYPGVFAASDGDPVCLDFVPRTWRVTMTGASTPSATFSVGYFGEF